MSPWAFRALWTSVPTKAIAGDAISPTNRGAFPPAPFPKCPRSSFAERSKSRRTAPAPPLSQADCQWFQSIPGQGQAVDEPRRSGVQGTGDRSVFHLPVVDVEQVHPVHKAVPALHLQLNDFPQQKVPASGWSRKTSPSRSRFREEVMGISSVNSRSRMAVSFPKVRKKERAAATARSFECDCVGLTCPGRTSC